jgi:DNA-binding CsgD family transcriptional regulator
MNKHLLDYCNYIKLFKTERNVVVIDNEFKIVHISNQKFFMRYSNSFALNVDIFQCLRDLPCFATKRQIYDNLIKTKRVSGYFVAQHVNSLNVHQVDSVHLSPILDSDKSLIGIELEALDLDGLPLMTLIGDESLQPIESLNLTEREREIIILKCMGKTNLEISQILGSIYKKEVSQHTIANIIKQQIYIKFKVESKPAMIKAAHDLGLDKIIPKSLITENQLILFPSINN